MALLGQGGADEFHPSCWLEDAKLKAWATSQGIDSAEGLLDYFHIKWQKLLLDAGRRPQFWCAVKTRPDPCFASATTGPLDDSELLTVLSTAQN